MTSPARREPAISKADVARVLTFIASYDQRTLGDSDVEAWHLVAAAGRWTLPYASRAVVEFQSERPDDRLRPGHITQIIRARREQCAATYQHKPYPGVMDTEAQVAWDAEQLRHHIDTCMARWASGEGNQA